MEEFYKKIEEGKNLSREKKFEQALTLFKQVLKKNNTFAEVYFEIGKIYFIVGQIETAKIYLEKAINLDCKQIYAYDLLIKIYNQENDFDSFEKMFEKVHLFFDTCKYCDNIEMLIILFNIARYINRYNQIIEILKSNIKYIKICSIQQKQQLLLALSDIYYRNDEKKKSIIYKYKYLQNNQEDTEVIIAIAKEYIQFNKPENAYRILKKALNIEKNIFNHDVWKYTSMSIGQMQEKEMIKKDLELFLKIIPDNFIKFKNVILNELEIINNEIDLKSKPSTIIVTLTSNCNINCLMCKIHDYNWQLPVKTKDEIIKLMPYLESVVWLGGEVFLYKYFEELFECASRYDVSQTIITNAMLLDEDKIIQLLKSNVNLVISVDGITKEVFEHIRVGASFDKLIETLKLIKFYRKKFNCKNAYRMNTLILKSNYKQIESFIDFAYEYGFNNLFIDCISTDLNTEENIFYYYRDDDAIKYINSVKQKIIDKAKKYNIKFNNNIPTIEYLDFMTHEDYSKYDYEMGQKWKQYIDLPEIKKLQKRDKYCYVPWKKLFVDRDGSIRPECFCRKDRIIGNVLNDSLFDVWNSNKAKLYRISNVYKYSVDEICQLACLKGNIDKVYRE